MEHPEREILEQVESHRDQLQKLGVRRLGNFGSAVRGELTPESDLDFLVEFDRKSFDRYMELKFYLEDLFGRSIDLVLTDAIKPQLRENILRDSIYAEGL